MDSLIQDVLVDKSVQALTLTAVNIPSFKKFYSR